MPAVSVITPAWNAAAYLPAVIASVQRQTCADWELLVVDDGSTDDTAALVAAAAQRDPRVRLIRQANAGPSAARNRAMREARGALFAFLDSDDEWAPSFLASQLALLDAHPDVSLVTATAHVSGGPFDGQPTRPPGAPARLTLAQMIADETAVFIMTVFRRTVYETIGGFDEAQWTSEDWDFWLRAAQAGFVFLINPEPLGVYRVRGDSLSRNRDRMLRGVITSLEKARARGAEPGLRAAIDAQIARFRYDLLLDESKRALDARDYETAARQLSRLRAAGGGRLIGVTAWLARHAPPAARLAYRARSLRPSWLREPARRNAAEVTV